MNGWNDNHLQNLGDVWFFNYILFVKNMEEMLVKSIETI